jgi:predicted transcriptional regulator of viral defense system
MAELKEINKLSGLLKRPFFTASQARDAGVHPSLLSYYAKQGLIERIERGIYKGPSAEMTVDFKWEDLVLAVKSIPNGVVCLISALALYELTEEIPRAHWIAIPNSARAPKRKGAKIIRMRNFELGQTEFQIGQETIRIFDRERTIVDAFRILGKETAIKALKEGLKIKREGKINLRKIQDYAKKLRVNIDPYILTATT